MWAEEVHVIDSEAPEFGQRKREAWTAKRWSVSRGGAGHRQRSAGIWVEEARNLDSKALECGQRRCRAQAAKRWNLGRGSAKPGQLSAGVWAEEVQGTGCKALEFGQRKREAWTAKRWSVGRGGAGHRLQSAGNRAEEVRSLDSKALECGQRRCRQRRAQAGQQKNSFRVLMAQLKAKGARGCQCSLRQRGCGRESAKEGACGLAPTVKAEGATSRTLAAGSVRLGNIAVPAERGQLSWRQGTGSAGYVPTQAVFHTHCVCRRQ